MGDKETSEALARAVNDLDQSRRVGWATSYDKAEKLDSALKELNHARLDAQNYRRIASFLLGYLQEMEQQMPGSVDAAGRREFVDAAGFIAESKEQRIGQEKAREAAAEWKRRLPLVADALQAKAAVKSESRRAAREGRDLMKEFSAQYHLRPGVLRAVLKAARSAVKTGRATEQSSDGEAVTVVFGRGA